MVDEESFSTFWFWAPGWDSDNVCFINVCGCFNSLVSSGRLVLLMVCTHKKQRNQPSGLFLGTRVRLSVLRFLHKV